MHEDAHIDEEPDFKPKSRLPLYAFLLALLGGAGILAYSAMTAVQPLKVLVAVAFDGKYWFDGSEASATITDEINEQLAALGFEPVKPGDPEVLALLEGVDGNLELARKKLNAAYLIEGELTPTVIEHPIEGGYFEARIEGEVRLLAHDGAEPFGTKVTGWSGAKDKARALQLVAGGTAPQLAAAEIIPKLLQHPTIAALLEGDATTVGKLAPAAKFAKVRAQKLSAIADTYPAHALRRQEKEKGPVPVTYLGDTSKEDSICGTGPGGYLVKTEDTRIFVSPRDNRERVLSDMETLTWRQPGGESTTLWSGYNVPNYPSASADGRTVAMCEDIFGWAKTVTIIDAEGARRLRLDPEKRFSGFELSPNGSRVAFYERACRKCEGEVVALETAGEGPEVFRMAAQGGRFEGMVWTSASMMGLLYEPPEAPAGDEVEGDGVEEDAQPAIPAGFEAEGQSLFLIDVGGTKIPRRVYTAEPGERLSWPVASPEGDRVAFASRRATGPGLLVVTVADGAALFVPVDARGVTALDFSPDGARIAFNVTTSRGRDEEVAVWDGVNVAVLTNNPFRDRYPKFSADGHTLFFESLDKDPQRPKRHVSLIASVPASVP